MSQKSFSFHIKASNPESRVLHALDKEFRALAAGRESLVFPEIEPKVAARMGAADWEMSPQPDGMWVRGSGLPKGLLTVLGEFARRCPREVSFAYSLTSDHPHVDAFGGGVVVINERGHEVIGGTESADVLIAIARERILGAAPAPKPLPELDLHERDLAEVQALATRAIVELNARGGAALHGALIGVHDSVLEAITSEAGLILEDRDENRPSNSF